MTVFAAAGFRNPTYSVTTSIGQTTFEIAGIQPNDYRVFAYFEASPQLARYAAGYTRAAVSCAALGSHCDDHSLLPVTVTAGGIAEGVTVGDWYGEMPPRPDGTGDTSIPWPINPPRPSSSSPFVSTPNVAQFLSRVSARLDSTRSVHYLHTIDCGPRPANNASCQTSTGEGFFALGNARTQSSGPGLPTKDAVRIGRNCWTRTDQGPWQLTGTLTSGPGECVAIVPISTTFASFRRILAEPWQYSPDGTPAVRPSTVGNRDAFALSFTYTQGTFTVDTTVEVSRETFDLIRWTEIDRQTLTLPQQSPSGAVWTQVYSCDEWDQVLPITQPH